MGKNRRFSIKYRILAVVILIQIPFMIVFLMYTRQVSRNVNEQLAQGYAGSLSVFCTALRDEFARIDQFLSVDCWANDSFRKAGEAESPEAAQVLFSLVSEETDPFQVNPNIQAVLFHVPDLVVEHLYTSAAFSPDDIQQAQLKALASRVGTTDGWTLLFDDSTPYFLRTISYSGARCTVYVDLAGVGRRGQTEYHLSSPIVFYQGEQRLNDALWVREYEMHGGSVFEEQDGYRILNSGERRYMTVSQSFMAMRAVYAVPYHYDWHWMYLAIWLSIFIAMLAFAFAWIYLQVTFFKPLNRLIQVMNLIREGNLDARANDFRSTEFAAINKTFNEMIDKIETLKIESYESQLSAKRSMLDALRLQIRRHFFLNCLKNIYGMSQSGDIEDVQQMVLLLSDHLRYTLDLSTDVVPLQTELMMCQNYINLQGIGQEHKPQIHVSCDTVLTEFPLPPVSLLTLIENCCKYGKSSEGALTITLRASRQRSDTESFVTFSVQDSGAGFDEEQLSQLNSEAGRVKMNQDGHVGIVNVLTRLRMIYGEGCTAMFSNTNGAKIELIIPTGGVTP